MGPLSPFLEMLTYPSKGFQAVVYSLQNITINGQCPITIAWDFFLQMSGVWYGW